MSLVHATQAEHCLSVRREHSNRHANHALCYTHLDGVCALDFRRPHPFIRRVPMTLHYPNSPVRSNRSRKNPAQRRNLSQPRIARASFPEFRGNKGNQLLILDDLLQGSYPSNETDVDVLRRRHLGRAMCGSSASAITSNTLLLWTFKLDPQLLVPRQF